MMQARGVVASAHTEARRLAAEVAKHAAVVGAALRADLARIDTARRISRSDARRRKSAVPHSSEQQSRFATQVSP